jgi:hypothetical protein
MCIRFPFCRVSRTSDSSAEEKCVRLKRNGLQVEKLMKRKPEKLWLKPWPQMMFAFRNGECGKYTTFRVDTSKNNNWPWDDKLKKKVCPRCKDCKIEYTSIVAGCRMNGDDYGTGVDTCLNCGYLNCFCWDDY